MLDKAIKQAVEKALNEILEEKQQALISGKLEKLIERNFWYEMDYRLLPVLNENEDFKAAIRKFIEDRLGEMSHQIESEKQAKVREIKQFIEKASRNGNFGAKS